MEQGFALYDPQKHKHHAFLYGGHDPGVCCGYHAADVLVAAWLPGSCSAEKPGLIGPGSRAISSIHHVLSPCPSPLGSISYRGERRGCSGASRGGHGARDRAGVFSSASAGDFPARMAFGRSRVMREAGITEMAKILAAEPSQGSVRAVGRTYMPHCWLTRTGNQDRPWRGSRWLTKN